MRRAKWHVIDFIGDGVADARGWWLSGARLVICGQSLAPRKRECGIEEADLDNSIVLRDAEESDLPILFEYQKDPDASWMAAFLPRDPCDRDAFLAHWKRMLADRAVIVKAILWKGRVAGTVGSFVLHGEPQVTYWIGKELWGHGIATQALRELLRVVTTRPIYASAASDNAASIRVLEKCGFVRRGSARAFADVRGAEIDEVFFELAA